MDIRDTRFLLKELLNRFFTHREPSTSSFVRRTLVCKVRDEQFDERNGGRKEEFRKGKEHSCICLC